MKRFIYFFFCCFVLTINCGSELSDAIKNKYSKPQLQSVNTSKKIDTELELQYLHKLYCNSDSRYKVFLEKTKMILLFTIPIIFICMYIKQ